MPRGMQMGMVDAVLRRLMNASATAYPPDVLGVSYCMPPPVDAKTVRCMPL